MRKSPWFRFAVRLTGTLASLAVFFALAPHIFAQATEPPKIEDVAATVGETKVALNVMWMLLCSFLIFFMQAGFALLESGMARTKNTVNVMMKNYMDLCTTNNNL